MNESKTQKFIELWTNQKQTGDSALVQSQDTITIYINSIRIIQNLIQPFDIHKAVDTQSSWYTTFNTQSIWYTT